MTHAEQVVSFLRDEGLRITPQRIAILDYLLESKTHPSADMIHRAVRERHPMVSLSTIYNTLDLLKAKNLVNDMDVDGETRYDAHIDDHINLICAKCGRIEDVDEALLREIRERAARRSMYAVIRASFELHGYCGSCRD